MHYDLEQLRTHALFIAGVPAEDRTMNGWVESAIHDAAEFLESLPPNIAPCGVHSGTIADRETILSLLWMGTRNGGGIGTISIAFLGNELCSVSWPTFSGHDERKSIHVRELYELDIPEKIRRLCPFTSSPTGPRPS